ncbi:hypothetical protein Tco_1235419 [Tanacetum coccineum]
MIRSRLRRAKHTEQITALKNENKSLKVQLQNTVSCVTTNLVKPNVLAPRKYDIDVEPILPRNRNNRSLSRLSQHLKESVDTLREIVEEAKSSIGIFVRYAPSRKGYRIYNKRTRQIMETIHVQFDELTEHMAPVQSSLGPAPNLLTLGPISSRLVPNPAPDIPYVPPTNKELEILFQPMFDEYFNPSGICQDPILNVAQDPVIPTGPSVSISIDLDAPLGSHISSPLDHHFSSVHHGVAGEQYAKVNPFAAADHEPFVNVFTLYPTFEATSSGEIMIPEPNQSTLPHEHIRKWTTILYYIKRIGV